MCLYVELITENACKKILGFETAVLEQCNIFYILVTGHKISTWRNISLL